MTESRQAGPRVLRAAALAVVTVTLALAAHLLGGGTRPGTATLTQAVVVTAVVMAAVMTLRAGHPRSTTGLAVGLGSCQLLLHQWFALATPGACTGHLATEYLPGGHALASVLPWGLLAQTARACATTGDATATMLTVAVAAHALAALLTGALVTRGEALLAGAVALLLPALPTRPPDRAAAARAAATPARVRAGMLAHRRVDRRGPPATCAACPA